MAEKLASFIVSKRRYILALFVLLCVVSCFTVGRVNINYDLTSYLDEETMTRRSLELMNREFGATETLTVLMAELPEGKADALRSEFEAMDGVMIALYDADQDLKYLNGVKYERVTLYLNHPDPLSFAAGFEAYLDSSADVGAYELSGNAMQTLHIERSLLREIPIVMVIAIAVVLAVLFLTSHSYIEPALFILVLIASILINMGTNFIFPSISFITFAVCAILQLALCMDYSIMLLHAFFELKDAGLDDADAVRLALARSLMPITSSSLTTVAGLVSLMFMSFTIGYDIGIVLSKGILISMLSVFTLMPALILLFRKPLTTSRHKPLPLGGYTLGKLAANRVWRVIVPIVLIGAVIAAGVLQGEIRYFFMGGDSLSLGNPELAELFGVNNALAVLVPSGDSDEDFARQRALIADLKALPFEGHPAVSDVAAAVTTGEAAIRYYTVEDVSALIGLNRFLVAGYFGIMGQGESVRGDVLIDQAAELMPANPDVMRLKQLCDFAKRMFLSGSYSRLILQLDIPSDSEENNRMMDAICQVIDRHYLEGGTGMTGVNMSVYDISNAFSSDLLKVNLITIAAIFLIICISFRSLIVPTLLICVIQGAVWINSSLSVIGGRSIFFMCYLICLAIQMGATIDYGILLTSNYIRQRGHEDRPAALVSAMQLSLPTIFTSGLILFSAGLAIGLVCSVFYISGIGLLVASGAFFSLLMVLILLPALLYTFDRFILPRRAQKSAPAPNSASEP